MNQHACIKERERSTEKAWNLKLRFFQMKFFQVLFSAVASKLLKYPRGQSGKGPVGTPVDSFPPQTTFRVVVESIAPLWRCSFVRPEPVAFLRCLELTDRCAVMR